MSNPASTTQRTSARAQLLARHPWLTFLLPFVVYMLAGGIEPSAPKPIPAEQAESLSPEARAKMAEGTANTFGFRYKDYPIAYTIKIALTIAAILFVLPGYRQFPFGISPLAVVVGVVGVVIWIAICQLHLEAKLLAPLGLDAVLGFGERPAYNPLDQLRETPAWAYTFLAIRFLGLALIVPIVEEFFLRGFLMRFVMSDRWWEIPFGDVTRTAIVVGTAFPMLSHLGEILAAAVWFSLVTWLMIRTRNIWDCVAAHAVTNLLLGIYVVTQEQWQLW
jgi:uncharacterized protein